MFDYAKIGWQRLSVSFPGHQHSNAKSKIQEKFIELTLLGRTRNTDTSLTEMNTYR